jgi:hypothetical protein
MGYSSIVWLPICAGLTALGLVLSYVIGRRRGHLSMLRGAAWSLLPLAAYLTGSVEMFWKIGDAIGHYADGFAFSPVKWAGIGVAGLSVLLFFSTGGRGRRKAVHAARKAARAERKSAAADGADATAAVSAAGKPHGATQALDTLKLDTKDLATTPAKSVAQAKPVKPVKGGGKGSPAVDDDMKDIDAILRKRGI